MNYGDADAPFAAKNSVPRRLNRAIASAIKNNIVDNMPWCAPPLWVSGNQYVGGNYITNSNGDCYYLQSSQSVITAAQMPTHRVYVPVIGADTAIWHYAGKIPSYLPSTVPAVSNPPVAFTGGILTDNMNGLVYIGQKGVAWTLATVTLTGTQLSFVGAQTGAITLGDPVVGTGVLSGTMITGVFSGTINTAGCVYTVSVNYATPVTPASVGWSGYLGGALSVSAGFGLTQMITPNALSGPYPLSVYGGITSVWQATGCTITGGVLTITTIVAGSGLIYGDSATWTGTQSVSITTQISSTEPDGSLGKRGTYQLAGTPGDQASFTFNNHANPRVNVVSPNVGTAASPSYLPAPAITNFKTNARWLGWVTENNLVSATGSGATGISPSIAINGRMITPGVLNQPYLYSSPQAFYLFDLSKVCGPDGVSDVTLFTNDSGQNGMLRLFVGPNDSVWKGADTSGLRIGVEGDSLTHGFNSLPDAAGFAWPTLMGQILGAPNVFNGAITGTGFVQPSSNTTYLERLPDMIKFNPDILITAGQVNDTNAIGTTVRGVVITQAIIVTAVLTYIAAARAALPNLYILIAGNKGYGAVTSAASLSLEAALKAAITALGDSKVFFIPTYSDPNGDIANGTGWWNGNTTDGKYFRTTGTLANAHPIRAEYLMFARRMADVIAGIFATLD